MGYCNIAHFFLLNFVNFATNKFKIIELWEKEIKKQNVAK
jgi:hypothetical protein